MHKIILEEDHVLRSVIFSCDICAHVFDTAGEKITMVKIGVFHKDVCNTDRDKIIAFIKAMEQEKDEAKS